MNEPTCDLGCDHLSRREAIWRAVLGGVGLAIGWRTQPWLWAAESAAAKAATAKAVIQIWLWGGPSHLDTFDPKPAAGNDYCGPFANPIPTKVDGVMINELLPQLAGQADKYALIRSMTHGNNGHETASYLTQTGREPGRLVYPCAGAVVSLFKGYDHGYRGQIPPYVVLTTPQGRFSEAGFLGQRYKPFATGGDPSQKVFAVEGVVGKGVTAERQQSRRELLHRLDTLGASLPANPQFAAMDKCEENAYEIILGEAGKVFDLTTDPDDLRQRYGRNRFGQSCLMARRLVEIGVPFVTINYGGWDTHKKNFETLRQKLPEMDAGVGTLIADLADRGLLDSTIVWWGGEFGRTPKIDWPAPFSGGRGHYGKCFSSMVAGGGFKGGTVVGASDDTGSEVATRPVHPQDLIGSMYELLGIQPDTPLPNPRGIAAKVMPAPGDEGALGHGRLREIMPA